jgi:hypothetical protein
MEFSKKERVLVAGAVIGAVLGAGVGYLLMKAPAENMELEPVTATDLLGVTGSAAVFIRKIDDLRRKL